MILAATTVAIPTMINVLANSTLRKGMENVSTILQNGRALAIKQNIIARVRFQLNGSSYVAYVDNGISPTGLTTSSPQLWLPRKLSKVPAPTGTNPTPLTAAACGSTLSPINADSTYYNQLGIPCQYSSGTCGSNQAYAHYFTYQSTFGTRTSWAAMCVSPAGRLKAWYWNGSAWKD